MIQSKEQQSQFFYDHWEREDKKGGGLSCVLQNGKTIEKAGVNTTSLTIPFSKNLVAALLERGKKYTDKEIETFKIYASGCSIVIHPYNPMAPTTHANFRYFELVDPET